MPADKIAMPSRNYDVRPANCDIDMLVLHYTGMRSGEEALARLCDDESKVSAHYLVEEDGRIFALVDEQHRAWHAGVSHWNGQSDINGLSVGIEIVNPGHEFGYRAFPDAQIASVIELTKDVADRNGIPNKRVLGHADVAPARKQDPGELFPWAQLAEAGIGLWPKAADGKGADDVDDSALSVFGYDVGGAGLAACITAFQRHWRQDKVDGVMDGQCRRRLAALLRLAHGEGS